MKKTTNKGEISLARFEILGLDKETRLRWKSLADTVKRMTNCFYRTWLVCHTQAGNDIKIREYIAAIGQWHKNGAKGTKPQCEVKCLTPEITASIRKALANYSTVNTRCLDLAMQLLGRRLTTLKASKSNYPRWIRILADEGEYPNSSSPLPIPFDKKNAELLPPIDNEDFQFKLRIDRLNRPGKMATSTLDTFKLKTRGRQVASQTAILWKIASGEYDFCGSNLVYKEANNKWFLHICYRQPATTTAALNQDKIAFLHAGLKQPWRLRIAGYKFSVGGPTGQHIAYIRRQLLTSRWGRQENTRYTSSSVRGHGVDRAMKPLHLPRLKMRWRDAVKTCNQQMVANVIRLCQEKQCGQLVYFQPAESRRDTRFLHLAGKIPDRHDSTSWDWYQVQNMLSIKCKAAGIELIVHKIGEKNIDFSDKKSPQLAAA
jgi:hypothetical protein